MRSTVQARLSLRIACHALVNRGHHSKAKSPAISFRIAGLFAFSRPPSSNLPTLTLSRRWSSARNGRSHMPAYPLSMRITPRTIPRVTAQPTSTLPLSTSAPLLPLYPLPLLPSDGQTPAHAEKQTVRASAMSHSTLGEQQPSSQRTRRRESGINKLPNQG